jgi:hypothetical protein
LYEESGFLSCLAFHRALSELLTLEPGRDSAAFRGMIAALDSGYVPGTDGLVEAATGFQAYGSPHTGEFLSRVVSIVEVPGALVGNVVPVARSADDRGIAAAEELAAHHGVSADERFDLLESALLGAGERGDADAVARIAERIDDLIVEAVSDRLDDRWIDLLGLSDQLRATLGGPEAELERVNVLRRRGRNAEAAEIVRGLFYRAEAGVLGHYDAGDLLGLFEELGGAEVDGEAMRAMLTSKVGSDAPTDSVAGYLADRSVRLLFVGGNERQRAYRDGIDADLLERYRGKVEVAWFDGAWSNRWKPLAEKVEAAYPTSDALVVMSLLRTNLGKRLRRTSGEAGLPWIPCTGTGGSAIRDSIDRALAVVAANGDRE